MYKTLRYISSFFWITFLLQFVMYYIFLILFEVVPLVLTKNQCGLNPNTQLCIFFGAKEFQAFLEAFSVLISAYIAIFLLNKINKRKKKSINLSFQ